jgi:hypothetical protein
MVVAHVAGFPLEETVPALAPVGLAMLVAVRVVARRMYRLARHPHERTRSR